MTEITIVFTNGNTKSFTTDMDYEFIKMWARETVECNYETLSEIIVNFEEGKMIFKAIS